jgi:translation initiation factor IF-2
VTATAAQAARLAKQMRARGDSQGPLRTGRRPGVGPVGDLAGRRGSRSSLAAAIALSAAIHATWLAAGVAWWPGRNRPSVAVDVVPIAVELGHRPATGSASAGFAEQTAARVREGEAVVEAGAMLDPRRQRLAAASTPRAAPTGDQQGTPAPPRPAPPALVGDPPSRSDRNGQRERATESAAGEGAASGVAGAPGAVRPQGGARPPGAVGAPGDVGEPRATGALVAASSKSEAAGGGGGQRGVGGGDGAGEVKGDGIRSCAAAASLIRERIRAWLHYPWLARRRGREGVVELRFRVDASGLASEVTVVRSAGEPLDSEAVAAVRRSAPFPPCAAALSVPVAFRLHGGAIPDPTDR